MTLVSLFTAGSDFLPPLALNDAIIDFFLRREGSATYSADVDWLFLLIFWISFISFFALMIPTAYFVLKYRRKRGVPIQHSPSHNTAIEVTWTVIPSIILVALFFVGFWAYAKQHVAEEGAVQLDLTAKKWSWDITYPNGSGATLQTTLGKGNVPIFLFPDDEPFQLRMQSIDVIHSFWVPDFRMKVDVFPNRFTTYWFRPERLTDADRDNPELGYPNREHWLFCAEYCGDDHSEMGAVLRVVPREVYEDWLAQPFDDTIPPVKRGEMLYTLKGCNACHSVDGSANTGPTWLNLYGYEHSYTDGSTHVADDNFIRQSIYEPSAFIRQGYPNQMASYQGNINAEELAGITTYMKSISDRGGNIGSGGGNAGEGGENGGDGNDAQPDNAQPDSTEPTGSNTGGEG